MRRTLAGLMVLAVAALAAVPGVLAEEAGDIARVTYWKAKDGMRKEFEEGLKKHNQFHADQNDSSALHTWQVVTGKHAGEYVRGSFGLTWADLDLSHEFAEADEADAAETLDPYHDSSVPVIYRYLADWSNSRKPQGPSTLARVIHFHVKNGMEGTFSNAIGKIHKALGEAEADVDYLWYEVVDGGDIPTYIVVLPSDDWAGFAPMEPSVGGILTEAYGEEGAAEILTSFESVDEQHSATYAYRSDLTYLPKMVESE